MNLLARRPWTGQLRLAQGSRARQGRAWGPAGLGIAGQARRGHSSAAKQPASTQSPEQFFCGGDAP
eukprot:7082956-Pyramimonas_sp.AAC.1